MNNALGYKSIEDLLLLSRVQAELYNSGSYKRMMIKRDGIFIKKGEILTVLSEEIINGVGFIVVSYNNNIYYALRSSLNVRVAINIPTFNNENNVASNKPSKASMPHVSGVSNANRLTKAEVVTCNIVMNVTGAVDLYPNVNETTGIVTGRATETITSGVVTVIAKYTRPSIISYMVRYNNKIYYVKPNNLNASNNSSTNSSTSTSTTNSSSASIVSTTKSDIQYTIVTNGDGIPYYNSPSDSKVAGYFMRGSGFLRIAAQDWSNGYMLLLNGGDGVDIYVKSKDVAPCCDDTSFFMNDEQVGNVTITEACNVLELHRGTSSYMIEKITAGALNKAYENTMTDDYTRNTVYTILESNYKFSKYKSEIRTSASSLNTSTTTYVRYLTSGTYRSVDRITLGGNYYYVSYDYKTSNKNGAIAYLLIPANCCDTFSVNTKESGDYTSTQSTTSSSSSTETTISTTVGTDADTSNNLDNTSTGTFTHNSITPATSYMSKYNSHSVGKKDKYSDPTETITTYNIEKATDPTGQIPGINYSSPKTPPEYAGYDHLKSSVNYRLANENAYSTEAFTHINRFHLISPVNSVGRKSFIFMTRPDLNLYEEVDSLDALNGKVNLSAMNPDLKRLSGFAYIMRLKGRTDYNGHEWIGNRIINSLEYYGTNNDMKTPWLSILSNQACGYDITQRDIDTSDMGETFHGNMIKYAVPTFKHQIAGTVDIPFRERRDLGVYLTVKLWADYIHAVSMGLCNPRYINRINRVIDYAVSLYYITTDETMENILYWEKLTGVFPISVPDSFFSWSDNTSTTFSSDTNITFAYSFRTVMDEYHLAEINNLYQYKHFTQDDKNDKGMQLLPTSSNNALDMNYLNNSRNNNFFARVAAFYGTNDSTKKGIADSAIQNFVNNKTLLEPYYYGGNIFNDGSSYNIKDTVTVTGQKQSGETVQAEAKFVPNWNTYSQTHGIPYVKGPYIQYDKTLGKYLLRWV